MKITRKALSLVGCLSALSGGVGCAVESDGEHRSIEQSATEDCDALQSWVGNDWRLSFSAGEHIEHDGDVYLTNVDVSYPNSECAPDAPVSWCSSWFTLVGACGSAPVATCDDGIQNQGEEDVDCGGPCDACVVDPTCDDGIQNQGEAGVDCGGPCDACATDSVPVPAQLEAEDFVRFQDTTSGHSGDCGSGPVDQQQTQDVGGGCNIGWTAAGEWLEYDVNVASSESFDVTLRLAARDTGKRAQVSVDGEVVGVATAPGAGWQSWEDRSAGSLSLSPGEHTIRVTFLDGGLNLNWLSLSAAAPASCSDGIQNQDETGVDCGGTCAPCGSPPSAQFSSPTNGDEVGTDLGLVIVNASDEDGIANVKLYLDGNLVRQENTAPYQWNSANDAALSGLSAGSHELRALVTDGSGETTESAIFVTVVQDENPLRWKEGCVEPNANPGGTGWMDSYLAADGKCYCDSTFDHAIGTYVVDTPKGPMSVKQVCDAIGPGPGRNSSTPIFNDIQCGNGPANDAGDEDWCPGRTDEGSAGCCVIGPKWDLSGI